MTLDQVQHVFEEFGIDKETVVKIEYGHGRAVTGTGARLWHGVLYLNDDDDDDEYVSSPIAIDVASIQMIARLGWPETPVDSDQK